MVEQSKAPPLQVSIDKQVNQPTNQQISIFI